MPHHIRPEIQNYLQLLSYTKTLEKGTMIYFSQGRRTLGGRIFVSHEEDIEALLEYCSTSLFMVLAKLLADSKQRIYAAINIFENLHIRIESISTGKCLYDSLELGTPSHNKTLCIGSTEKSFISFCLAHSALWKKYFDRMPLQPDTMYRKYLHLGIKPASFKDYVEKEGSMLWHAFHSDLLPRPINEEVYYEDFPEDTIPF